MPKDATYPLVIQLPPPWRTGDPDFDTWLEGGPVKVAARFEI